VRGGSPLSRVPKLAAKALGLLADRHVAAVVDAGAIPPLVQLVSSSVDDVCGEAICALGHIAGGSVTHRELVLAAGILEPLLKVLRESSHTPVLRIGAWLLVHVHCREPSYPLADFAPFVAVLLNHIGQPEQDQGVLECALTVLTQVSEDELRHAVRAMGLCGRLVELLAHDILTVRRPASWLVALVAGGTDADRDALVECGAMASIKTLLESAEADVNGAACLTAINMTTGTTAHRQAVIDADLVPVLINVAAGGEADLSINQMAATAIGNIARGSQQQTEHVAEFGGIQPLCDLLEGTAGLQQHNFIVVTLPTLDKILAVGRQKQAEEGLPDNTYGTLVEQAGGVDKVAALQTHSDVGIAVKAAMVVAKYFPDRFHGQRLTALIQEGVIQVVRQPGGGEDDQATQVGDDGSDGDSYGEREVEVDGQLEGDSGEAGEER